MPPTTTPVTMRSGILRSSLGRSRWSTVRVEAGGHSYVGRVYVPETKKRVSDVLEDDRQFLFMTEVCVDQLETVEPFLAINKSFVNTVRILHDGEPEAVPRPA